VDIEPGNGRLTRIGRNTEPAEQVLSITLDNDCSVLDEQEYRTSFNDRAVTNAPTSLLILLSVHNDPNFESLLPCFPDH
jgi:hypothetical protein